MSTTDTPKSDVLLRMRMELEHTTRNFARYVQADGSGFNKLWLPHNGLPTEMPEEIIVEIHPHATR